ncbi:dihydropyrimidinase [Grosmannia clavigera kw1407]|uniref:Dihydropyrimidinase n=1 Tax=Grosmannia clavigera (strain kw1407 / UAMH 11150) TaxID=655863 RepID=F0XP88_GROCL|nr:dihydropyrimidinase [Grosmannia clavigera kw1407]EFX00673.1 dihydropyrimidinase [Grosmannia clavigera kw1407]
MATPFDLVITNGVCVTASDVAALDVGILDGKIAVLAPSGTLRDAATVRLIDAEGGYVMPGGVDCHVHLQEPSLFGKGSSADTFETGTRSAVAGGTTTVVAFAPQQRGERSLLAALDAAQALAAGRCHCDYGLHLLVADASSEALDEVAALAGRGVTSLKIYMTYAALQLRDGEILSVLAAARANHILTMVHAENGDVLEWLTARLEARGLVAPRFHAHSRPGLLEAEATGRAIALAGLVAQTPILLVHVSDGEAAGRIREAQTRGQPVFAETCPQYLFLTRAEHLDGPPGFEAARHVCSPPPRDAAAQDAVWAALRLGTFAVLSSDHCPFRYDDATTGKKACITPEFPLGRFRHIPNGLPGVETRLPLALAAAAGRHLPLTRLVETTATNPAKLYGLYPRKGALLPGLSDADVVVWYPPGRFAGDSALTITNSMLHHDVDYTPYEGRRVDNWPRYTILRGRVVWDRDGGGIVGQPGDGQFLHRHAAVLNDVWTKVDADGPFDEEKL